MVIARDSSLGLQVIINIMDLPLLRQVRNRIIFLVVYDQWVKHMIKSLIIRSDIEFPT